MPRTRTFLLAALIACAPASIARAQGSDLLRFSCAPGILGWLKPGLRDREFSWETVVQRTYARDTLRRGPEWFR